jgi:hypothetical protein
MVDGHLSSERRLFHAREDYRHRDGWFPSETPNAERRTSNAEVGAGLAVAALDVERWMLDVGRFLL